MTSAPPPILVIHCDGEPSGPWVEAFCRALPGWTTRAGEDLRPSEAERVVAAVVWAPPPGFLGQFPHLATIVSIGTGLDHLDRDPSRPPQARVAPRRDPGSTRTMAEFVLMQILIHHRRIGDAIADRPRRLWRPEIRGPLNGLAVSLLGFGPMAQATAELLAHFGCATVAWSRNPRAEAAAPVRSGWGELDAMFGRAEVLVNLLPSTAQTRGLIDDRRLGLMPRGAGLINVGRADILDHAALIRRLDRGDLAFASLDVAPREPPDADDPLWTHPRILLTPHVASLPQPDAFAEWAATLLR